MKMLTDPYERHIDYLRISLTDRCNLRCVYCLPGKGVNWLPRETLLKRDEIVRVVQAGARLGICKVRLTGGEPLLYPELIALVEELAAIPGIADISMTTNGMLLEKMAKPLFAAGLKRVNLSLDTLDPAKFRRITRFGEFTRAWQGLLAAEEAGLAPVKLNTVVVGGVNDDELENMARLTLVHPWHVRFIELMPVGNLGDWGAGFPPATGRYVSVQEMRARLAALELQPVGSPVGNGPARSYRLPGALGTVGFIAPLGEQFCTGCNRLRLTADGRLRACLLVEGGVSLLAALRGGQALEPLIEGAVATKPSGHAVNWGKPLLPRRMAQIGG